MDRDAFDVHSRGHSTALQTSEKAAAAVLRSEAIAATHGHRLHSIGVTWSDDADAEASLLLKSLTDSGYANVVAVRLPDATEALARGIAEVIGFGTTAVCVLEPETVIVLIVHLRDGAVQTVVNHAIVTEEDLIRWLSAVFTRADWQPEALVMVGSGGDDEMMPILEDALCVPVFAPAEAQLALARGAALVSAQNVDFAFFDDGSGLDQPRPAGHRRRQLAQTGPLALLVAGVLTFTVSASVAVSLELAPKKNVATSEPAPAAKATPAAAVVTHVPPPVAVATGRVAAGTCARSPAGRGCAAAGLQRDAGRHPRGARGRLRRTARCGTAARCASANPAARRCAATHRPASRSTRRARRACAGRTPGNPEPDQGALTRRRATRSDARAAGVGCRGAGDRHPGAPAAVLTGPGGTLACG